MASGTEDSRASDLARCGSVRARPSTTEPAEAAVDGTDSSTWLADKPGGYPREGFFLEVARDDDFVGVQAYTRTIIGPNGPQMPPAGAETTLTGWEYFPAALGIGVRNAWNLAGRIPILVTENGIATDDDTRRIAYMQAVLLDLHDAMAEGVDVRGYIHWSALDNYEWGSYDPTFGLIAVDRTTFARTPKPSLGWLGNVAQARSTTISAAERKRYGHRFTPRDHRSRRA